jgi:tryptophan-rich hypothetical protein
MKKSANNQINPAKLLLSKWTAAIPKNKEKHFLVTDVIQDELGLIRTCVVEAVLTNNKQEMPWQDLKDNTCWLAGWL